MHSARYAWRPDQGRHRLFHWRAAGLVLADRDQSRVAEHDFARRSERSDSVRQRMRWSNRIAIRPGPAGIHASVLGTPPKRRDNLKSQAPVQALFCRLAIFISLAKGLRAL